MEQVFGGQELEPSVAGPPPRQDRTSRPITPLAWWESEWVQLGAMVLPALAFASYPAVAFGAALTHFVLERPYLASDPRAQRVRRWAPWVAGAGLATVLGFVAYFGLLMFTAASVVGAIVVERPIAWLALQVLAVTACVFTVLLAASWRSAPKALAGADRARTSVLLAGGTVFAAWAAYWGLLLP